MLVLALREGEHICIGDDIRVIILDNRGSQMKIGIEAPADVPVHRAEVYKRIKEASITPLHSIDPKEK